ncbi:MAG: bacterial transcriptional activator domain-containing protein, partial [Candidatus Tumulicola sp.]
MDVDEFVRCAADSERYEQAARLYRGDLLEGVDERWLEEKRRELSLRYSACLLGSIAFHRARRSFAEARRYANLLLAHDPWREDALRQLLVVQLDAGNRAAAVAEYRRF